ncbi:MAG TPA: 16S rRNA (cytosine(967)-C(5))-methyltransferase RsmB [Gammaproteobacteria bacterium]|nr:16S rRNA (cytosine(967)-C(5))-methyltransferase RsmB [Gammaproteobacteria bacterium]
MNYRLYVALLLKNVLGENKNFETSDPIFKNIDAKEQSKIKFLCFTLLRNYYYFEEIAKRLLSKPLKKKDYDIFGLLLLGLYELSQSMDTAYAIVHETVACANHVKKDWSKGLLNATLRRFIREHDTLCQNLPKIAQTNHPQWLLTKIQKQWPEYEKQVLEANQKLPPLTLRVNQQQIARKEYLTVLNQEHIEALPLDDANHAVMLKQALNVLEIPGFANGAVSIQDLSAQFAPDLLALTPHLKVLDACAAPGGKTAHLLETEPTLQLDALDIHEERVGKLTSTLARLGFTATIKTADARETEKWWDQEPYDRILLDAPCTGSGVIKRHPEIKIKLKPEDLKQTCALQEQLLDALWPTLKLNGILLYITCSIFQEENVMQIEKFLQKQGNAKTIPLNVSWGIPQRHGQQILPTTQHDGFYYALLTKI